MSDSTSNQPPESAEQDESQTLQEEADEARENAKRETAAARAYAEEQVNEVREQVHKTD